jgi:hypothetical protein
MAKKKSKSSKTIKTAQYWTKTCSNPKCNFEYPNWFTVCPRCHMPWTRPTPSEVEKLEKIPAKKTIKIVVKITEESPENPITDVKLAFTADGGNSWFQVPMEKYQDYYVAEIEGMPFGSKVIYYIEAEDASGEKFIENNDGKYFSYYVEPQKAAEQIPNTTHKEIPKSTIENQDKDFLSEALKKGTQPSPPQIQSQNKPPQQRTVPQKVSPLHPVKVPQKVPQSQQSRVLQKVPPLQPIKVPHRVPQPQQEFTLQGSQQITNQNNEMTIFGKPQLKIDENLKICPNCQSKIKKLWTTCPICGAKDI